MDETISLVNKIFLLKTIRFDLVLKIVELSGTNNAAPHAIVDVLMGKKPPTILKTLIEKNKTVLHNKLIRDMQKSPFLASKALEEEGHKVLKNISNALWYLDGRAKTINETSKKRKNVTVICKRSFLSVLCALLILWFYVYIILW